MDYANPSEPEFRDRIIRGLVALASALDVSETAICRAVCKDSNFMRRMRAGENFTFRKYDAVMAACSALLPEYCKWPEGLPRPAPRIAGDLECQKLVAKRNELEQRRREAIEEAKRLLAEENAA